MAFRFITTLTAVVCAMIERIIKKYGVQLTLIWILVPGIIGGLILELNDRQMW